MEIPQASLAYEIDVDLVPITLADGYTTQARLFDNTSPQRAVLYLHGIQSHGGWFLRSCAFLAARGFTVLAPDRRGSGLNTQDRGHCNSPDQLIEDVDHCVDWLRKHTQIEQIDIVAVSWSGKLALVYAAEFLAKVRSLALVTPGLRARVDISLKEKIFVGINGLVHPHNLHEIPLNDPALFTTNPRMLRFIEADPLKLTQATASFFITSTRLDLKVPKVIDRLGMPIYLFLAEHDQIIDNPATIELLRPVLTCLPGSQAPARIYPGTSHTLDFEPNPELFFEELASLFTTE